MRRVLTISIAIITAILLLLAAVPAIRKSGTSSAQGTTAAVAAATQTASTDSTQDTQSTESSESTGDTQEEAEALSFTRSNDYRALSTRQRQVSGTQMSAATAASGSTELASSAFIGYTVTDAGDIESRYAILVDVDSGRIIAGENYAHRMNPASMTKILTLLVAAEHGDLKKLDSDRVTITQEITDYVYSNGLSAVNWGIGDKVPVRDLYYGTALPSGADAALALAQYTAGSEEGFVKLMNEKLRDLGLSDTAHFTNMTGCYDRDHFCTVEDMAVILAEAQKNDFVRQVLSARTYKVAKTETLKDGFELSNRFLRNIDDADVGEGKVVCAKTGYVENAGFCAASSYQGKNGHTYVCVTGDALSQKSCRADHAWIYRTLAK